MALLNELFTFATEIVQRRGGMIDKFIGDCVMAVWGAPETHPDDALRAVQAARGPAAVAGHGQPAVAAECGVEIQLAIGVHTGPAVAGNVGSEKRMEYTVIGDTVNVAARLEAMAQPGQILVSESTRERHRRERDGLCPPGAQALHGRTAATRIYEVARVRACAARGRVIAGRFRVLRALGAGGMGAVYEAEQLGLGRTWPSR